MAREETEMAREEAGMADEPVPAKAGNLEAKVFAGRELRYLATAEGGAKQVRVV